MAKFKTNHSKSESGSGMIAKVGIFAVILGALFWGFNKFSGGEGDFSDAIEQAEEMLGSDESEIAEPGAGPGEPALPEITDDFLPTSTTGEVIKHSYYALSYSERHEQAEWVAYELTRESLYIPNVERTGNFRPDPKVRKASASIRDYKGSGYDRGHLVPAGDMAFSRDAMSETFYMSNMSPQIRNFNSGVWRELEENIRDWGKKFKHLYIVTGPVLTEGIRDQIGGNDVSVPELYYKVLLDLSEPEIKAIAFLIPNEVSTKHLSEFAVSINRVEELTGIDFFPKLLRDGEEEELESMNDIRLWPINSSRYDQRVDKWNKRK